MKLLNYFLIFGLVAGAAVAMGAHRDVPPPVEVPHHDRTPDSSQVTVTPSRTITRPAPAALQVLPATQGMAGFKWQYRPLVVFADTPQDPAFVEQMRQISEGVVSLMRRDVVVITDTAPDAYSEWRQRLNPTGFAVVVMGKDGQVKQRKPLPWSVREISRAIDKFPLRRREIKRVGSQGHAPQPE